LVTQGTEGLDPFIEGLRCNPKGFCNPLFAILYNLDSQLAKTLLSFADRERASSFPPHIMTEYQRPINLFLTLLGWSDPACLPEGSNREEVDLYGQQIQEMMAKQFIGTRIFQELVQFGYPGVLTSVYR
jgi:hypothetical protein